MAGDNFIQDIMGMTTEERLALAMEQYNNSPGFFTPYKSFEDFSYTLISPITAPLLLGAFTALLAVAAAIAAILAIAALLTALATCACSREFATEALVFGLTSAGFALAVGVIALPLVIIATVLSVPLTTISVFTRTAATAVNCCVPSDDVELTGVSYG